MEMAVCEIWINQGRRHGHGLHEHRGTQWTAVLQIQRATKVAKVGLPEAIAFEQVCGNRRQGRAAATAQVYHIWHVAGDYY
jgi:hypothetical protein